ncbi:MAG: aminotransferase class I/II-fold pyridoxal phosphate-dependent enzyme [Proteobacteria bacterium]|nr:aminotransferase class I/II-fold pyridoxal phosphate-dependent enzyme [Pseudomonadota bacterium]
MIDLRSDTVTKPTPAMWEAMQRAELGDDGWRDDPTVLALEERAAERLGKEAGLFLASGTMANLVAILAQIGRGEEVLAEADTHIIAAELGGIAALAGVPYRGLPGRRGAMDLDALADAIRGRFSPQGLRTGLVCTENTHTAASGAVLPMAHMVAVAGLARAHGVPVHLDGARMFNAAVALGVDPAEIAATADTACFCICKGLGAPAGAVLVGPRAVIERALAFRKQLGGAMRQVGILAAAGIVALDEMVDRLADDHRHARRLALGLQRIASELVDPAEVETNLIILDMRPTGRRAAEWAADLKTRGVLSAPKGPWALRLVTHRDIGPAEVERVLEVFGALWRERAGVLSAAE